MDVVSADAKSRSAAWYRANAALCKIRGAARYAANKEKRKAQAAAWYQKNKARRREKARAWQLANKDKFKALKRGWINEHTERFRQLRAAYRANNPEVSAADSAARRARLLDATPAWANKFFMREAYRLAGLRTLLLGYPWHVDHIVPLKSKFVCGLHVENNLRVIPGVENMSKGNRQWPGI